MFMEKPDITLEDIIGSLFNYSPRQYDEYISVEQFDKRTLRIKDVRTNQIFDVPQDRVLEDGALVFKEYAISKGAHIWNTIGYHWNNQAEILLDFDLYAYKMWARGREEDPFYSENNPDLIPVPNPFSRL